MSGLMPREHGAYAQLGFPLATGLILARGDLGAVGFAVVAISLFLMHEPVAVLAGVRGARLKDTLSTVAWQRILILGAAAGLGLVAAIALAPSRAWMAALLPGGLALLLLPALGTRRLKSLPGETLVAAVFSSSLLPLALCGPVSWRGAGVAALVWFAAVLPAILAVHAIKVAFKGRPLDHHGGARPRRGGDGRRRRRGAAAPRLGAGSAGGAAARRGRPGPGAGPPPPQAPQAGRVDHGGRRQHDPGPAPDPLAPRHEYDILSETVLQPDMP